MSTKWTSLDMCHHLSIVICNWFWSLRAVGWIWNVVLYCASFSLFEQVPRSTILSQWWSQPSATTLFWFLRFRQMMTCHMMTCKIQRSSSNSWSRPTSASFALNSCWNSTKMAGHCLVDKRLRPWEPETATQLSSKSTSTGDCSSTMWQAHGIRLWELIFMFGWRFCQK